MKLPLYQFDAFSEGPFSGNPAAVVPLTEPIAPALMQAIAEENNLSETAFTVPIPGAQNHAFALRWFTPTTEVELCGHATLAAAAALRETGALGLGRGESTVAFSTKSGELIAHFLEDGDIEIDLPAAISTQPIGADRQALTERALGTPVLSAFEHRYVMAVLSSEEAVRDLPTNAAMLAEVGLPVIATAPASATGVDFVSRFFAPTLGVLEDPVTGSAHCQLVPYWAAQLDRPDLSARQISGRGGALRCRLNGNRVHLRGHARLYLAGEINV